MKILYATDLKDVHTNVANNVDSVMFKGTMSKLYKTNTQNISRHAI